MKRVLRFRAGLYPGASLRAAGGMRWKASSAILEAHDAAIREEFKRQAQSGYGSFKWYKDMEYESAGAQPHTEWVVAQLPLLPGLAALDVASGTGICARAVALHVASVVGLDQTPEMLAEAEKAAVQEGLTNVSFTRGNALNLPFEAGSFDLVTCRLAVHHFYDPHLQVKEMARVAKVGGKVALIDMTTSDDPAVAARYNHMERLRDPTHTAALSVAQLKGLLEDARLHLLPVPPTRSFPVNLDGWMDMTSTADAPRREIVEAVETELQVGGPDTGMRPRRGENGSIYFLHEWAVVVAEKRD